MSNRQVFVGDREFFPTVDAIRYEGPGSDNPLAFKRYDPERVVAGKRMEEHLRFCVCYWHTFRASGQDPFGSGTRVYAWDEGDDPKTRALNCLDAAFEFFSKLGAPYYAFHDVDMAPERATLAETEAFLQAMVAEAGQRQRETGIRLLWGTANLFSHPRYMNGAATNPDFKVLARAAAQVKIALDATIALGGENYVFWGGREGYASLNNTNTYRELEHFAKFLGAARDYARSAGFSGTFLIEPKPMEPMKHNYDFDAQTVIGFLRQHGLAGDFKLNIEANHATLAGHSFGHELRMAADAGLLGSIDSNRGDPQNGWDTDQFPLDLYDCVQAMLVVLENGGLRPGGLNFDARQRRESVAADDVFLAHIGGMDAFAHALVVADSLLQDGRLLALRNDRYKSFDSGPGAQFAAGKLDLVELHAIASDGAEPELVSGRQEYVENLINEHLIGAQ